MMAGSDFIKTSTGKEAVNATLSFGIVMARAIKEYHQKMGYKVRENVTLFSTIHKTIKMALKVKLYVSII